MSQAMNQKTATSKKKTKKSRLPVMEEPEELSGAELLFEKVKPHLTTIGLVVVAGVLGFIAIAVIARGRYQQDAAQWRDLSTSSAIALRTGDISGLKSVAESYPDSKAGLWALQMAGDQQLRMGIEQLSFDREAGNQLITKAKDNFQEIVDAEQSLKSTMLDRRSHFSLAYAHESLGQFKEAQTLYEQLIELAPDSAFAEPARRGLARSSNSQFVDLYTQFANFEEEVIGTAPGPNLPDRPVIEFLDLDAAADNSESTNNDFVPNTTESDGNETEGKESDGDGESATSPDNAPEKDAENKDGSDDQNSQPNDDQ